MSAQIIDGKKISQEIRSDIAHQCAQLKKEKGITPGLAVVLVGDHEASKIYVRHKEKACHDVGFYTIQHTLSKDITQKELLKLIDKLNHDPKIHGILVQLPLPQGLDEEAVIEAISPHKDVDGFHPLNMGHLLIGKPGFKSCTPFGLMKLLEAIHYDLKGKNVTIVGRSNIVGKPAAILMMQQHATITICHSRTHDLPEKVRQADVVVAAIGKAHLIKGDWIKPGAVVLDVGMNRLDNGKLVGDVDFEAALSRASYITPVPGGVGPMTITMLLWNTLEGAKRS
ncbi:MAG: bifunctional 5,10-methylene-tetrahydrofolate dehydrogenase/5,10-methylene-tetrahydrofolate cyclohydrolase [Deltaproteobacteria bacterium RIFCSPHIGHO2_02_FULL_50_15]|nr:MAG: bifunctional 5,10-methylene-tetrahydrofolate dehydrogenase/5,10-methylene-tetrahydrofolate cyclohydrolase [Deltaproteobacteria bacterium RIFCSPHIGHO2_02_FULL_50_15]